MSRTPPLKDDSSDFTPCPAGAHNAVVVDVSEPYEVDQVWEGVTKKVWKRHIAWQVSKRMPAEDGQAARRFIVLERFTDTLSPKGKLRAVILSIIGRDLTSDEEGYGFEMEGLVGKPCLVQVVHNVVVKDGKERTYANVTGVMALPEDMKALEPEDWTRWQDREPEKRPKFMQNVKPRATATNPDDEFNGSAPGPDSDIPF